MSLIKRLRHWFRPHPVVSTEPATPPRSGARRGVVHHVIILDGTMSSLEPGRETNAGLTFRLLREGRRSAHRTVYYEPGLQWGGWMRFGDVALGRGINRQIRRAYGYLASHYQPGDRIYLFGYSRGAYAVRSLAGVIDRVGLLTREEATERNVQLAYRHYQFGPDRPAARAFARACCHPEAMIEMVGVWDTVKALGFTLPLLWKLTEEQHSFHSHRVGRSVRHGFQALALDETRDVFEPVLWEFPQHGQIVQQAWFRGSHGDIGGQIGGRAEVRPLANIPLVWMLERAESCGLELPEGWRTRFPCDASAPMTSTFAGWGKIFLLRHRRRVGQDPTEYLHPSAGPPRRRWGGWLPAGHGTADPSP